MKDLNGINLKCILNVIRKNLFLIFVIFAGIVAFAFASTTIIYKGTSVKTTLVIKTDVKPESPNYTELVEGYKSSVLVLLTLEDNIKTVANNFKTDTKTIASGITYQTSGNIINVFYDNGKTIEEGNRVLDMVVDVWKNYIESTDIGEVKGTVTVISKASLNADVERSRIMYVIILTIIGLFVSIFVALAKTLLGRKIIDEGLVHLYVKKPIIAIFKKNKKTKSYDFEDNLIENEKIMLEINRKNSKIISLAKINNSNEEIIINLIKSFELSENSVCLLDLEKNETLKNNISNYYEINEKSFKFNNNLILEKINELKNNFDFVLVNTIDLDKKYDALAINNYVDMTIINILIDSTKKNSLKKFDEILGKDNENICYIISK